MLQNNIFYRPDTGFLQSLGSHPVPAFNGWFGAHRNASHNSVGGFLSTRIHESRTRGNSMNAVSPVQTEDSVSQPGSERILSPAVHDEIREVILVSETDYCPGSTYLPRRPWLACGESGLGSGRPNLRPPPPGCP